ncbi:uncharacterized protein LOC134537549 [Bacillus rossius redtenbacheri]|uniref:uncharacterized protein LOC134537549 n=1 Tax=Bacillus rossius redtenbacheri TaxID=93214 RepID=UPI002FDE0570
MRSAKLNVDKYRTEFECDEHWELRRKFLIAHRDKFSEDELVCLAQTFTNIEFLGCRYPEKTMQKVAQLAQGVVDEYREKQKGRLQRTFVAASDAAGAKAKGLKRPSTEATPSPVPVKQAKASMEQSSPVLVDLTDDPSPRKPQVLYGPEIHSLVSEKVPLLSSRYGGVRTYHITKEPLELKIGRFGKLVLVESKEMSPYDIIQRSMNVCNIQFSFEEKFLAQGKMRVRLYVNNELVCEAEGLNTKVARENAAKLGLQKLKESCYTILIKHKVWGDSVVDRSLKEGLEGPPATRAASEDTPLSDDNVGSKLLRLMGWSGGGLGRSAQGISEPISAQQERVGRAGLGLTQGNVFDAPHFRRQAGALLRDYADRDTDHDLVFTSEFTTDERKVLHTLAHNMKLKTKSIGKKDIDRYLVVSKRISFWDEAKKLLASGGSSDRYELIPPVVSL